MATVSLTVSFCTMVAIALERYLAIVHPFLHRVKRTKGPVIGVIVFIWVLSISLAIGVLHDKTYFCANLTPSPWFEVLVVVIVSVSIVICTYAYTRIFLVARDHVRRMHGPNTHAYTLTNGSSRSSEGESAANHSKLVSNADDVMSRHDESHAHIPGASRRTCEGCRSNKIAKMTFLVLVVMILCWLPFALTKFISLVHRDPIHIATLYSFSSQIVFMNSWLNPLLYCWQNSEFRKAYKRLLCCK